MYSTSTPPEPRAKRTHARRSCDLCKVRKTRCELPDLEIPSSMDPLPAEKACHRCKVLVLPCVVDDSSRKQRKRSREEAWASPREVRQASPKRRLPHAGPSRTLADSIGSKGNGVNHSLDLLHGFHPTDSTNAPFAPSSAFLGPADRSVQSENESDTSRSIRLHGRPYGLVCAMLRVAYGRNEVKPRRQLVMLEELDMEDLVDLDMRARLESGVSQLRSYHPYLDPLPVLFDTNLNSPSSSGALLLSTVLYLASLSLPPDQAVTRLRHTLTSYIISVRDTVMLQLPDRFAASQALDLLTTHAPLGALPFQLVNPGTLGVARGQQLCSTRILQNSNFSTLWRGMSRMPLASHWETNDTWIYFSLCATEASMALEDEVPKRPTQLNGLRELAETLMAGENAEIWMRGAERDPGDVLGKLAVCDRLARLGQVHDGIARTRGALEAAAAEPNLDLVEAVVEELKYYTSRMEAIDSRYDTLVGGISPSWLAYRRIRRHFEATKVYMTALRILMATPYLPGTPTAFPGLPTDLPPSRKAAYAISRASNPQDILPFLMQSPPPPAVLAVWEWGTHRGDICEQILVAIAELGNDFVPFHDVACIAVESAKVLMEMVAGWILMKKTGNERDRSFRIANWFNLMKQVSQVLRGIGHFSADHDEGGESIPNGCSNLVGSMVRMADEWGKTMAEEAAATSKLSSHEQPPPKGFSNGHAFDPNRSAMSYQRYMNTSDRWMATDHEHHGGYGHPVEPQPVYPPTPIDLLLSEVFNYSYPSQAVQPPTNAGEGAQQGWGQVPGQGHGEGYREA